jgi:hypothetical protein
MNRFFGGSFVLVSETPFTPSNVSWLAEQLLMSAPPVPEPERIEDDAPEPWEIAENAGPTLVELCGPYGGGPDEGEWVCWDVDTAVSRPQLSEVA